ncbi:hypothetical protein QMO14_17095 [Variovorax sp. CAN2819]|uniref:hypothetical protein n=1 Tax=Variovorax sp. CAN15 TaxID=3046727 RepID=UPI002648B39B|nr:hypothetical protein [Variovorax sp. CAN15]MDN6885325.1 hypothetical protein [Variovorax sp. CAN15]
MSAAINTGGPAFPVSDMQSAHATAMAASVGIEDATARERAYILARAEAVIGMTMRDYFAAQASEQDVQAALEDLGQTGALYFAKTSMERHAIARYAHADAMLKVRAAS